MAKTKRKMSLATKHSLFGYAFISPFLLGFLFLILSPFVLYIVMGFSKVSAGDHGMQLDFVKWSNYEDVLFNQTEFFPNVLTSLKDLLITGVCVIIFSFFIAVLLNQKFHGRGFVRAIFFLPVVIASGACALSQNDALSSSALSAITDVSGSLGDGTAGVTLTGLLLNMLKLSISNNFTDVIEEVINRFYNITMMSGVQILIFLAALQGISPSLYEAARIDGATGWETFWKVTFPLISPMILVNSVYTVVDYMSGSSNIVINQLYKLTSEGSKYGISSAMGTFYFLMIYVILGLLFLVMSKFIHYED